MSTKALEKVHKHVLSNGLTVLVRSTKTIPKVSTQLWYNVGSKDEATGEKGIAHLIEHMIFKGTTTLSESDINLITHKLSGYCNAFTSYDYTGYLFDFPSNHWTEALPIMADCMENCTFKQELLNSEMKAVIQELKMYRDNYTSSVIESLIGTIFEDHPYHHPIIGYKQDLWSVSSETLHAFYKKHYVPNNATLVVVGDVDVEEVFQAAEKNFGHIKPNLAYKKNEFYHTKDLVAKSVTLHRDVQQSTVVHAFEIPGAKANRAYALDALSLIIAHGKSSRLHKKLVDELELVTHVESFYYDLFDHGLFFILYQPISSEDIPTIQKQINQELATLKAEGFTKDELQRATKQAQAEYLATLENAQKQAYLIGQAYVATNDENYLLNYLDVTPEELEQQMQELLQTYFVPSVMHTGSVLPLMKEDTQLWKAVQAQSDQEDARILSGVTRTADIEEGKRVHEISVKEPKAFAFPKPQTFMLPNGLKVLTYHNPNVPKIDMVLEMKAKHYYDPEDKQGLLAFTNKMILEGTKNFPGHTLADALEIRGMTLAASPGYAAASMLHEDFEFGLSMLHEILTNATLEEKHMNKDRTQLLSEVQRYWDEPSQFVGHLIQKSIYGTHPYSKQSLGTRESLESITHNDILTAYTTFLSPSEATLAIVGDLHDYNVQELVQKHLGQWRATEVESLTFPELAQTSNQEITYPMNRDQVVLAFATNSVNRFHKDFDKILLFDQIFTGGVLGSMSSRLFALREQSGLFYTIGGSLLAHTDEQPGIVYLRTIVSQDRLQEAETAIMATIATAAESIEDHEFEQAQNALINSLVDHFETNHSIASSFLFLQRFNLPDDYFDKRAAILSQYKKEEVAQAAQSLLTNKEYVIAKIGRV